MRRRNFSKHFILIVCLSVQCVTIHSDPFKTGAGAETDPMSGFTLEPSLMFATESPKTEMPPMSSGSVTMR